MLHTTSSEEGLRGEVTGAAGTPPNPSVGTSGSAARAEAGSFAAALAPGAVAECTTR